MRTQLIILTRDYSRQSGIVRCLPEVLPDRWLAFGCDSFVDALPAKMQASDVVAQLDSLAQVFCPGRLWTG